MEAGLITAVQQMKNSEEKGFNEVYSKTYNRVYFRARQIMQKEEDAQDLTQIVFVEAFKNIHTLQATEALYSWLDGITYNQGMKIYRKQREVLLTEDAEGMFDTIESNDISSMPELTADQKATADIIKGIIEELPELQRAAVVAYYFDGMKVEQIANMMECSVNTIKSRLNYARKYIKDRVEEKEKKEGYRLHVFGLPVLWYAIRMMAEKTTLTVQAAQSLYNGACAMVGLRATVLSVAGAATTAGAATAGTAGATSTAGATAGAAGMTNAGGAVTVAQGTAKAAGLGAKLASLSMTAKVALIAGTVAVAGAGTAGFVNHVNHKKEAPTQIVAEDTVDEWAEENVPTEITAEPEDRNTFVLTEESERQISAFVAAAYQCNYSAVNRGEGFGIFEMSPDECLFFVKDYIDMVNYTWNGGPGTNAADLPYSWYTYAVTPEQVREFFSYGLGIEIPDNYSFSYQDDAGSVAIVDGELQSTFDARTVQITGGKVEIISQNEDEIVLEGTCYWYDPEPTEYRFRVTGVPNGKRVILGGLMITDIEIIQN